MISCNEDNVIPEIIGIELEDLVITELDQNEIENFPEINSFLSVSKGHTPITVFNVKSESMDMSGLIFEFPNNKTFATFHNKDTTLGNIDFSFWMTEYDNGKLSLQHKENSEDLALLYLNDNGDLNFDRIS